MTDSWPLQHQLSITINGPLSVTCAANNTGDVGVLFNSGPMAVTGGIAPYMYSIVGTLPAGCQFLCCRRGP